MKIFTITYYPFNDSSNEVYTLLHELIKKFGKYNHPFRHAWLLQTSTSINDVTKVLQESIGSNDSLMVIEVTATEISGVLPITTWDWINKV